MKQIFILKLNGDFYGKGDFAYIQELITNYVYVCDIYGKDSVSFEIARNESRHLQQMKKEALK